MSSRLAKGWRFELLYYDYSDWRGAGRGLAGLTFGTVGVGRASSSWTISLARGTTKHSVRVPRRVVFNLSQHPGGGRHFRGGHGGRVPHRRGTALIVGRDLELHRQPARNPFLLFIGVALIVAPSWRTPSPTGRSPSAAAAGTKRMPRPNERPPGKAYGWPSWAAY